MGLIDFAHAEVRIAPSGSESSRFGRMTDRIVVGSGALDAFGSMAGLSSRVSSVISASVAEIVIVRYPSSLVALLSGVDRRAFDTLPAGCLIYWQGPDSSTRGSDVAAHEVGVAERKARQAELNLIIADSFAGYVNHYSANPVLDPDVVVAGYLEWASHTMARPSNRVFLTESDGAAVGIAIVSVAESTWEIELASVVPAAQRAGHYTRLIVHLLNTADASGKPRVVISTQAHNIGVQRAWAKLGFLPIDAIETVHLLRL
jgi:ribosomal protein S18 acetylase RimI-like enzyme